VDLILLLLCLGLGVGAAALIEKFFIIRPLRKREQARKKYKGY